MIEFPVTDAKAAELRRRMEALGIREPDLEEQFIHGGGSGGQKQNKTSNCVRLRHIPTGLEVKVQQTRSRAMNRFYARRRLCDLIENRQTGKATPAQAAAARKHKQKARRARRGASAQPAPAPPRILLTGFEPFGGHTVNSSWEAASLAFDMLEDEGLARTLALERLPVDYERAQRRLWERLAELRPDACLCLGMARTATAFRLETQARHPEQLADLEGEPLHAAAWPHEAIQQAFRELDEPLDLSADAGQYVCESTLWALLEFRRRHGYPERAGFLHVPLLSDDFALPRAAAPVAALLRALLLEEKSKR